MNDDALLSHPMHGPNLLLSGFEPPPELLSPQVNALASSLSPMRERVYLCVRTYDTCSVTRLGKISPLWQYFKSLDQFCKGLFSVWLNFELTLVILLCERDNFH